MTKRESKKQQERDSYLQGSSHKAVSGVVNRNISDQMGLAWNIQNDKKQGPKTEKGHHLKLKTKIQKKIDNKIKSFQGKINK